MRGEPLVGLAALAVALSFFGGHASANERHFTQTYESVTLPAGVSEVELWTTWRAGRERFYNRFDERLEFELGLVDHLQTALYVNLNAVTATGDTGERSSEIAFAGISSEWKLSLLDPVADRVGLALYGELTVETGAADIEGKVILDRRIDNVLLAGNLIFEHEWEFAGDETETEVELEADLAGGVFVMEALLLGLELRTHLGIPEGEFESAAFFFGPTLAYSASSYFLTLSVLPQIAAIKGSGQSSIESSWDDDPRDLEHHEAINARVLIGVHL